MSFLGSPASSSVRLYTSCVSAGFCSVSITITRAFFKAHSNCPHFPQRMAATMMLIALVLPCFCFAFIALMSPFAKNGTPSTMSRHSSGGYSSSTLMRCLFSSISISSRSFSCSVGSAADCVIILSALFKDCARKSSSNLGIFLFKLVLPFCIGMFTS